MCGAIALHATEMLIQIMDGAFLVKKILSNMTMRCTRYY
jgi:hypothetical protein